MGIIGSAIGAGLGQGMAMFGGQLMQNEANRQRDAERAAERWEIEREKQAERRREQQAKLDLDREKIAAEAAKPLSIDQVAAKALADELGRVPEPDPARYTGEMTGPLPEGEDDSARALADPEGYAKARQAAQDKKIGIINRIKDPSAAKSLREADYQSAINTWARDAANEPDPQKREAKLQLLHRLAIAAEGKELFKGDSDVTRNVVTGATDTTAPGKAQVTQREAAAAASRGSATAAYARAEESRADARLSDRTPSRGAGGKDEDGLLATLDIDREVSVNEKALARRLGTDVKDMNAALARLQSRAENDPKAKEKLDSLAPLIQSLEEAEQRLRERNAKKSQRGVSEKKADGEKKTASPPRPSVGEVRRGYRYNGGDPSKQTSWSKV
jgi:hypothetical protein